MADWTDIPDTSLDPDAPLTSNLAYAWRDNVVAVAEGADGAPKIAVKTGGGSTAAGTLTFTGLDDFGGAVFHGAFNDGASNRALTIALSDDGTTFAAAGTLFTTSSVGIGSFTITVDFVTGEVKCVNTGSNPLYAAITLAGAGASVTAVRLVMSGASGLSAIILPNGGESAS